MEPDTETPAPFEGTRCAHSLVEHSAVDGHCSLCPCPIFSYPLDDDGFSTKEESSCATVWAMLPDEEADLDAVDADRLPEEMPDAPDTPA